MRILIVAPEQLPLPGSGSVEICILAIAKQLAKKHKVTVVSGRFPGLPPFAVISGVKLVRVATGSEKAYTASVLRWMKGKRFDVIQVDNRPKLMARIKRHVPGTPVSLFLHSLTFVPKTGEVAACLKWADQVIANSKSLGSRLQRRFGTMKKLSTVYLGVDTDRFKPVNKLQRARLRKTLKFQGNYVILFAGRLIARKGLPVLIRAAGMVRRSVPRTKLIIAGSGKKTAVRNMKRLGGKVKVPVSFVGKVPHDRIHRMYQAADCFVCPSQRHEAFGLVNVEAMSAGLPVVASNIGGIKEIIRHGKTGYLVNAYRRPASFARYIARIARHKKKAEAMAHAGRQDVVRRFHWKRTAGKLARIYKDL